MSGLRPPEVVRERVSRLTGDRLACALIFEREFSPEEIARFQSLRADVHPVPADFELQGRVLRYECLESDEARWRLAAEIFLVKTFRAPPAPERPRTTDARVRMGLRPLQR
jgi:hypothetical protein